MQLANLVVYLLVGKVCIFVVQKFPLTDYLRRWELLDKLIGCQLCLGTWIYWALALILGTSKDVGFSVYVPVLTELIIGACASFVMWIFSQGWDSQFKNYIIE